MERIIDFKRKIYKELLEWKKRRVALKKEAIIIKGARQVGKTSIIEEFGKNEYDSFVEINFVKRPDLKSIFSGAKDPMSIYSSIGLW